MAPQGEDEPQGGVDGAKVVEAQVPDPGAESPRPDSTHSSPDEPLSRHSFVGDASWGAFPSPPEPAPGPGAEA